MEETRPYPIVSIVIPCRNEQNYIQENIKSILNQNYEGEIEILIVDGMSDDGTREIVFNYQDSGVILLDNPHQFTPHAMNIGINAAKGKYFVILGGHSFLDENFIRNNVEVLENNEDIGCCGGQIKNMYENEEGEIIAKGMASKFGVGNATFRIGGNAGFVDTVAFGMYRAKIHQEIEGFDEELVRNQDDEYNFKLSKAGYKIYFDPKIVSHYYVRGSYKKLYKQYYQYGYWKVYVNKKHNTVTSVRQLIPFFFVLSLIVGIVLSFVHYSFFYMLFLGVLSYSFLAFLFGFKKGKKLNDSFKIASVFPILHFSYGFGYLLGIFDFIVRKKKPSKRSKTLSRK